MKRNGMRKSVYALCFLLLLQAVSFPVFADLIDTGGEINIIDPSDNNLGSLTVSGGVLYPAFSAEQTEYLIVADSPSGAITVKGVPEAIGATVRVADIKGNMRPVVRRIEMLPDGSLEIDIDPSPDYLLFRFDVTSQNGARKSYTMKLIFEKPAPARLSGLTISEGALSPGFDQEVADYAATVANETRAITVTGLVEDVNAAVSVNGKSASEEIALVEKVTEISIVVTAAYETDQKTYTLRVTRAEPTPLSGNNDLSGLLISEGSLTPTFEAEETSYAVRVGRDVTSIAITGTVADEKATMTINGDAVSSGLVSMPIELVDDLTTVSIAVRAEDGIVKTYTVRVTKEAQKSIGRVHHLVSERTFGGRTIARFDDLKFGLIVQRDESGLIDYRVPIRTKANDVRLLIPYADVMTKITKGARDLVLSYQGHEIRIPMAVFEGDWLAGMPCETEATFEIHLSVDETGQTTYTIDCFVVEQINEKTRLVHRRKVQK